MMIKKKKLLFVSMIFLSYCVYSQQINKPEPSLALVKQYADEMIKNGRDHYGSVHSPLFAVALRRDTTTLLPFPEFKFRDDGLGDRWEYGSMLNIPMMRQGSVNGDHGMEKGHKQTVTGEDPLENLGLYKTLFLLSDVTGDDKYRNEARKALLWFFQNTQGPSGLYPWGEHLSWDFRYDYVSFNIKGHEDFYLNPTDFRGTPITQMYQSFQHEPQDNFNEWNEFLDVLLSLPARDGETLTPAERFAVGIWQEHFFDKKTGGNYNRHGDYFGLKRGIEGLYGDTLMFPRFTGYFADIWTRTYLHSKNEDCKSILLMALNKLVDANIKMTKKFGYRPFIFNGGNYEPAQCLRMSYSLYRSSQRIKTVEPELAAKMMGYAEDQLNYFIDFMGSDFKNLNYNQAKELHYAWKVTHHPSFKKMIEYLADKLVNNEYQTSNKGASAISGKIDFLLGAYRDFENKSYLQKANELANYATKAFFTKDSSLPKCVEMDTLKAINGDVFLTFYHAHMGSDDLCYSLLDLWVENNRKNRSDEVKATMQKVADWQLNNLVKATHNGFGGIESVPQTGWIRGALYSGILATYESTGVKKYLHVTEKWAKANHWKLGERIRHADDQCVVQVYADLYKIKKDPRLIAEANKVFRQIASSPMPAKEFGWGKNKNWSWCDALFMAPPAWAKLFDITKDRNYLELMDKMYWETYDYLYDKEEHLFYRDDKYKITNTQNPRTKNGQKIFWGRGNAWVLGGLARTIQYLPENFHNREKYISLFREMCERIKSLQQPDGVWRSSLLDPEEFSSPEASCSSFFCFALAWGINNNILERETYLPLVERAWIKLTTFVNEDGKLGWIQPVGHDPQNVTKDDSMEYGVGAFLLAGSEMIKLTNQIPEY